MRDNQKRMTAAADPAPQASESNASALNFATPTEFVDLPSKGAYYPEGHPLHGQSSIEIKFMTARDEDILTSPTLLKKGLAIDKFLQNIIVNRAINVDTILSGDKNAILVASRINGFGAEYITKVSCPACQTLLKTNLIFLMLKHMRVMILESTTYNKQTQVRLWSRCPKQRQLLKLGF